MGAVVLIGTTVTISPRLGMRGDTTITGRTLHISGAWKPEKSQTRICPARGKNWIAMLPNTPPPNGRRYPEFTQPFNAFLTD